MGTTEIVILGLAIALIVIIAILVSKKSKNSSESEQNKNNEVDKPNLSNTEKDNQELIAVITAAINAYSNNSGKKLIVKSFRRVGDNTPIWNRAARLTNNA